MSGSSESTGPEFCGNSIVQWPEPTPRLGFAKGQQTSGATEFERDVGGSYPKIRHGSSTQGYAASAITDPG
jgi:hypothetical protein